MEKAGGNPSHLSLPPLKTDTRSEASESIYKADRPSSIPLPSARPGSSVPIFTKSVPPQGPPTGSPSGFRPKSVVASPLQHRFLSPAEWARIAHGLGAIKEGETHTVVHPTCWYWAPKGLPDGLYKDVITQRSKYFILYHLISTLRWFLLIFQIVLGAILTALGSVQGNLNTPITVLAALNTVCAGLLALMHNSGLPDRYRLDKVEFMKVEDSLKALLDTGIIEQGQSVDDVLSDCFIKFQNAKTTVLANMPDAYTTHPGIDKRSIICPDPPVHFYTHS